jgi:hypothetical protein
MRKISPVRCWSILGRAQEGRSSAQANAKKSISNKDIPCHS